ncbi:MAG: hypothetical protein M3R67_12470, partial [Acidobacteriota bacterium]|nr:hypothetical protein [Acidobacteriota bacterium]
MPVRYPPEKKPPTGMRPRKDIRPQSRIVAYAQPEISFRRRFLRRLISPPIIIPLVLLTTLIVGTFVYYWTVFS